jgi:non-ribosomal peptide synthase protein (TIGR01720 family)
VGLGLASYADAPALLRERDYWLDPARGAAPRLPADRSIAPGGNDEGSASWVERTLGRAATETLLQRVPSAYNTRTLDVLLTALVETLGSWMGARRALVDLEGHGREEIAAGVDVSGTIGWFTTLYPLWIDLEGVEPGGSALKHVKETLRAVPLRGLGYGVLRYMSRDAGVREAMRSGPSAEISFNYLGQVAARGGAGWRAVQDRSGRLRGDGPRPHLIEVIATVIDSRLVVRWIHGPAHAPATIRSIADRFLRELTRLIDHCTSGEAGGYTPSDFAAAAVSQRDLDKLVARLRQ